MVPVNRGPVLLGVYKQGISNCFASHVKLSDKKLNMLFRDAAKLSKMNKKTTN
jgi:hypothetical protein